MDADAFLAQTPKLPGSWWPDWDAWLAERSGALRAAPQALGNRRFRAQAKAPGTYVLAR
jgi:polyhydroxyalkanoate synthase